MAAYRETAAGYGEAEALLVRKHPENFNAFGGGIWRGRIYAPEFGVEVQSPVIYHGAFGTAGFKKFMRTGPATTLMLMHDAGILFVRDASAVDFFGRLSRLLPLAIVGLLLPVGVCGIAGAQAALPQENRMVVAAADGAVVLPATDRPRLGALSRTAGATSVETGGAGLARFARAFPQQKAAEGSAILGRGADYWIEYVASILRALQDRGWPTGRTPAGVNMMSRFPAADGVDCCW